MVILSLDTAVIIALLRRRSPVARDGLRAAVARGDKPVVSVVVLHELIIGSWLSPSPALERARVEEALLGMDVVDLSREDMEVTGRLGASLRRQGCPIGDIDTLIAGQALARGWTAVTSNVKHFGRVEGLPIIDWSVGPDPLSERAIAARVRTEA